MSNDALQQLLQSIGQSHQWVSPFFLTVLFPLHKGQVNEKWEQFLSRPNFP
jgi:hypothetical protein